MASSACGCWTPKKSPKGVGKFEKHYIQHEIKKVVKKVGEGEDDFVLVDKIIEHKDSIKGTIDSHASEVGVYQLIERALRTGDNSLLTGAGVKLTDEFVDLTKIPEDAAEVLHFAQASIAAYNSLPESIRKGRSYEEFLSSTTTAEDYAAWVASLTPAVDPTMKEGEE